LVVIGAGLERVKSGWGSVIRLSQTGFWTATRPRSPAACTSSLFSRVTIPECLLPIGAISTISPSISSTRSSGARMPASPMR
jgi:hypothetical protein